VIVVQYLLDTLFHSIRIKCMCNGTLIFVLFLPHVSLAENTQHYTILTVSSITVELASHRYALESQISRGQILVVHSVASSSSCHYRLMVTRFVELTLLCPSAFPLLHDGYIPPEQPFLNHF